MKLKHFTWPLVVALLAILTVPAFAVGNTGNHASTPTALAASDVPLIIDEADIITDEEEAALTTQAETMSDTYECNVYLYVTNTADVDDAYEFAKQVYTDNDLGYGADKSGMMLMLNMDDRSYALIAHGYGNTVLTDHGRDVLLEDKVLPQLSDDNYYDAFSAYLSTAEDYLVQAHNGAPFDVDTDEEYAAEEAHTWNLIKLAICIIIPLIITAVFCGVSYSKMKTAKSQRAADFYIPENGCEIKYRDDQFLYQTETRVTIKDDDSDGGTSVDSDGFSGSSGNF